MVLQRDHLWKAAFYLWMQDFVRFFYPNHYDEIDWTKRFIPLDKELNTIQINSRPKDRVADMLVMLHTKSGKRLFILLHIEIQGYSEDEYAYRVHQMRYRIEDRFNANPVMLTVFTDDNPDFHPTEYKDELWGSGHRTFFNTYKVMNHPPSTYIDPENPVSLIMEIVYTSTQIRKLANDNSIMNLFTPLVKKLLSKKYTKEHIYFILSFIEAHVKFGDSRNYRIFEQKIEEMVETQTGEELAAYFFDTDRRVKDLEKETKEANREIALNRKEIEWERQEKEQALQEKERERQEKERALARGVLGMLVKGIDRGFITQVFQITLEDIDTIQEKYKTEKALNALLNEQTEP